ncbi:hypothetical protein [Nonomuraea cavernae]|uniref:hypothetical protein n=1 Tax=Nonomuraea cavernae TaxID=2045107 RepID=UPI00340A6E74
MPGELSDGHRPGARQRVVLAVLMLGDLGFAPWQYGLAGLTGPRTAIAIAGLLLLTTPFLLPRHDRTLQLKNADEVPPERRPLT